MLTVFKKLNSLFKYKWLNKLILFICKIIKVCGSIQIYHKFTTETKVMYNNTTLFGTKKKKSQRLNYHVLGHFSFPLLIYN